MASSVGLKPTAPQKADGRRMEPAVCVPMDSGAMKSATAAADPAEDAAGVRLRS